MLKRIYVFYFIGTCIEDDVRIFSMAGYDRFQEFVSGEAQICLNSIFVSICDDSWDNSDASVICRQIGFSPFGIFNSFVYVYSLIKC